MSPSHRRIMSDVKILTFGEKKNKFLKPIRLLRARATRFNLYRRGLERMFNSNGDLMKRPAYLTYILCDFSRVSLRPKF